MLDSDRSLGRPIALEHPPHRALFGARAQGRAAATTWRLDGTSGHIDGMWRDLDATRTLRSSHIRLSTTLDTPLVRRDPRQPKPCSATTYHAPRRAGHEVLGVARETDAAALPGGPHKALSCARGHRHDPAALADLQVRGVQLHAGTADLSAGAGPTGWPRPRGGGIVTSGGGAGTHRDRDAAGRFYALPFAPWCDQVGLGP